MSFSTFAALMIIVIGLVAFFHYIQGLFSSIISVVLVVIAAAIAVGYHESVVEALLGGVMADSAHAMVLIGLFAAVYLVLRILFDKLVPNNVTVPAIADRLGGALIGLVAGVFVAGILAMAAQSMGFGPALMGYARYPVEAERRVQVPTAQRALDRAMYDVLEPDTIDEAPQQMLVPVDDALLGAVRHLSERGALKARPVSEVHPDWLQELFGQRLGIQPGGKRVAANLPGKGLQDVFFKPTSTGDKAHADAGVYRLDSVPVKDGEFHQLRQRQKKLPTTIPAVQDPSKLLVVVRAYFARNAIDKGGQRLMRFSTGAVRLVSRGPDPAGGGELVPRNYFPIGTLDNASVMYAHKVDDFLFLDDGKLRDGANDPGVDFVFQVDRAGFLANPREADPSKWTIRDGTFVEFKRLARESLGGMRVLSDLAPNKLVGVMRKPLVVDPESKGGRKPAAADPRAGSGKTGSGATTSPGLTGSTPKPTGTPGAAAPSSLARPEAAGPRPVTPPPATVPSGPKAPAVAPLLLVGGSASARLPVPISAAVAAPGQSINIPGGSALVDKGRVRQLTVYQLMDPQALGGGSGAPTSALFVPDGKSMVQVTFKPNPAAAAADPVAWREALPDLYAVASDGTRSPVQGMWASFTVAGKPRFVVRYNADTPAADAGESRGLTLRPVDTTQQPTNVTAVFWVPTGATVQAVTLGEHPLATLNPPVKAE